MGESESGNIPGLRELDETCWKIGFNVVNNGHLLSRDTTLYK